jgi:hypothetical protein
MKAIFWYFVAVATVVGIVGVDYVVNQRDLYQVQKITHFVGVVVFFDLFIQYGVVYTFATYVLKIPYLGTALKALLARKCN